ncbi:MAG TPA: hypothetical protein VK360_01130 [Acidimicrobiales bacterium]|nr:hypothetical protein [Acidimicrobiales bacterium]
MFTHESIAQVLIEDHKNEIRIRNRPRPRPPSAIRRWGGIRRRGG